HQTLGVLLCLLLGRAREPERWAAAAYKSVYEIEQLMGFFDRMIMSIALRHPPYDSLHALRSIVCQRERSIIGQPHVDIRPILHVVGKKLALQFRCQKKAASEKNERNPEHRPPPADGKPGQPVIGAIKATTSFLLDRRLGIFARAQKVIPE